METETIPPPVYVPEVSPFVSAAIGYNIAYTNLTGGGGEAGSATLLLRDREAQVALCYQLGGDKISVSSDFISLPADDKH